MFTQCSVFKLNPITVISITVYHVGGALGWSDVYFFMTYPDGTTWSPRIVLFGDMGNENAQSLSRLQEETQRGFYDAIFHVGESK